MRFDTEFDFRTEVNIEAGEDPDEHSPRLREYHRLLWSKPLPSGDLFNLDIVTTYRPFLHHVSPRGEFFLTSDSAMPTWIHWKRTANVIAGIPEPERQQFRTVAHQIGGKLLFPGQRMGGNTINQERGRWNGPIVDRMDLTLECIRLHYLGQDSPLARVLARYGNFFELFGDFQGYVDFFLLQDLVSGDYSEVKLLMPETPALPETPEAYRQYSANAIRSVEARNRRMTDYVDGLA